MTTIQKISSSFFEFIAPIFPRIRDMLVNAGIVWHYGRQRYSIGYLAHDKSVEQYERHLLQFGFHKYLIAWKDDGEVLSMRKLDNFDFCYHIRLFEDGEIRGHYERTVESNFIAHLREIGMEPRAAQFRRFVGSILQNAPPRVEEPAVEKSAAIAAY